MEKRKKYNQEELKRQFVVGGYKTLKEFADKEGIPYSTLRKFAVGWVKVKNCNAAATVMGGEPLDFNEQEAPVRQTAAASLNERVLGVTGLIISALEKLDAPALLELLLEYPRQFLAYVKALEASQKLHRTAEGLDTKEKQGASAEEVTIIDDIGGDE
ncbi:MAG: hypothetical protein LBT55_01685 [Clostridiaceae bacterium]|nr:hypothetical protein [Clostridiaceae bacterium]